MRKKVFDVYILDLCDDEVVALVENVIDVDNKSAERRGAYRAKRDFTGALKMRRRLTYLWMWLTTGDPRYESHKLKAVAKHRVTFPACDC